VKKKIGILTFHYAHNYGAVLQAYALKTKLQQMGYDAQVMNYQNKYIARLYRRGIHIDFWKRDILPSRWGRIAKLIREQHYGRREWQKQWQAFEQFIREKLIGSQETKVLTLGELEQKGCDVYILGSDQIWARELTHGLDPAYFGQFAPDASKISYAASVPNGDIPEAEKPLFAAYLKKLSAVSVREERLAKELEELLGKKVTTVVDPTLLLKREDYDTLLQDKPIVAEPYLFVYYVVESPKLTALARKAAAMTGYRLVELHYHKTPEREKELRKTGEDVRTTYVYTAGPGEFLTYLRDAKMVMTNSFHGTVFSILFGKKFYSVYETNGRIGNLLHFLGLEERHITGEAQLDPDAELDYRDTEAKLNAYRQVSVDYLKKALEG
jgi:hypothetical protein